MHRSSIQIIKPTTTHYPFNQQQILLKEKYLLGQDNMRNVSCSPWPDLAHQATHSLTRAEHQCQMSMSCNGWASLGTKTPRGGKPQYILLSSPNLSAPEQREIQLQRFQRHVGHHGVVAALGGACSGLYPVHSFVECGFHIVCTWPFVRSRRCTPRWRLPT